MFISDINNSSFRIYSAVAAACKYSIGDKNKNINEFCKARERGGIGDSPGPGGNCNMVNRQKFRHRYRNYMFLYIYLVAVLASKLKFFKNVFPYSQCKNTNR